MQEKEKVIRITLCLNEGDVRIVDYVMGMRRSKRRTDAIWGCFIEFYESRYFDKRTSGVKLQGGQTGEGGLESEAQKKQRMTNTEWCEEMGGKMRKDARGNTVCRRMEGGEFHMKKEYLEDEIKRLMTPFKSWEGEGLTMEQKKQKSAESLKKKDSPVILNPEANEPTK